MPASDDNPGHPGEQRLDKWLWFARVFKSRTQAAAAVAEGKVRINRERILKPSQATKPGDVLTVAVHEKVLVIKVLAPGIRRGPAPEARTLYEDVTSPRAPAPARSAHAERDSGAGRPSKRDRRLIDRLKGKD